MKFNRDFYSIPVLLAVPAIGFGLITIIGSLFNSVYLQSFLSAGHPVKFNTSLVLLLSGLSVVLAQTRHKTLSMALAWFVFLISLITISEHLLNLDLVIDQLFPLSRDSDMNLQATARMSLIVAISGLLVSIAILLNSLKRYFLAQTTASVLFVLIYASLLVHVFRETGFYTTDNRTVTTRGAVLSFLLLSVAVLMRSADRGWLKTFSGNYMGGIVARTFLGYFLLISPLFIASYIYVIEYLELSRQLLIIVLMSLVTLFTLPFGFFTLRRINRLDVNLRRSTRQLEVLMLKQSETIKELRIKEEHLRLALESANMGTWSFDLSTGRVTTSSRTRQLYGFYHDDVLTFESILSGIHPDYREAVSKTFYSALDPKGNGSYRDEYIVIGIEDKVNRWVRSTGIAHFDDNGRPLSLVGTVLDITEQKESEDLKNKFIAMASHELKTPLTGLIGYVQLLSRKTTSLHDSLIDQFIGKISGMANQINKYIAHLLDVSAIQAGKLRLEYSCFSVDSLLQETVSELCGLNENCTITVEGRINRNIYADAFRLSQVITNFTSNAIKYSPQDKHVLIFVSLINEQELRLAVKDNGLGISIEDQEHLFQAFSRAKNVYANNIPGIGLGLHISSEIIKAHRGEIGVRSRPGEGSEFFFTIPCHFQNCKQTADQSA